MTDFSDRNLLERLKNGDMGSFRKLFDEKYTIFYCFIKGMIKNAWLAEDITQNIFMKVWINRDKLDSEQSIHSYLYVLAKNEVRDYFKLKANMFHNEVQEEHKVFSEDFEGSIDAKIMQDQVSEIVENMPEQRKQIYLMSREKFMSNKEIAEKLNLSVRTVERHILLSLKDIRKNLPMFSTFLFFIFSK